jgi:hypothetical protein
MVFLHDIDALQILIFLFSILFSLNDLLFRSVLMTYELLKYGCVDIS